MLRVLLATTVMVGIGNAAVVKTYTDRAEFEAAIENSLVVDFEAASSGDSFAGSSLTIDGLTLTGGTSATGANMIATNSFGSGGLAAVAEVAPGESLSVDLPKSATAFGADFGVISVEFSGTFFQLSSGDTVFGPDPSELGDDYTGFFGFTTDTAFSSIEVLDSVGTLDRFEFDNVTLGDALPDAGDPPDIPGDGGDPSDPLNGFRVFTDRDEFESALRAVATETFNDAAVETSLSVETAFDGFTIAVRDPGALPVEPSLDIPPSDFFTVDGTTAVNVGTSGSGTTTFRFDNEVRGFGADFVSLDTAASDTWVFDDGRTLNLRAVFGDDGENYEGFLGVLAPDDFTKLVFASSLGERSDVIAIDNITTGQAVPLPPAMVLFGAGSILAGLATRRRR